MGSSVGCHGVKCWVSWGQVLGVIPSLQVELEEIESKAEEYPLTRAFLTLIEKLVSVPIPSNLGTGHRIPGFQPYLEFLRDSVFLKFDTRAYSDPNEKAGGMFSSP